jgi:PleD family two-component response regulator
MIKSTIIYLYKDLILSKRHYEETIMKLRSQYAQTYKKQTTSTILLPPPPQTKRILIIDDEADINLTLKLALEEEGFQVDTFD